MCERKVFFVNLLMTFSVFAWIEIFICQTVSAQNEFGILPIPTKMEQCKGHFVLKDGCSISYGSVDLQPAAEYLSSLLKTPTGYKMQVNQGKGTIQLMLSDEGKPGSYTLEVTEKGIHLAGNGYGGVVSGIATLRQLFTEKIETKAVVKAIDWMVPCVKIVDEPNFEWRGMMLDVSRHFFSKSEVKELLDVMALYKLNKFHWHLTDDQGWRIEIKKYPLLTRKGAWRSWNGQDRQCMNLAHKEDNQDLNIPSNKLSVMGKDTLYGGSYTQEDIKEVVAYATVRGIDVIPEIDMPGHFLEAISHYKGISCSDAVGWGEIFSSPICPGKESALEFCKNVYGEVFKLFPYKYVHIGGDEVEKDNWKKCPDCQRRILENQLKDEKELQAWFIKHMEKFFNENGKQMIGWDEILEGGLSETATVMWWRSWQPNVLKETTIRGNKVICSPNTQFYLDYQQDKNSLRAIYDYQLLPKGLSPVQQTLVMGIQGNLWAEGVPSRERMFYMAFPRVLAIAELGWSKPERMNWEHFTSRMLIQLKRLDVLNINYRIPDLEGFYHSNVFIDTGTVNVTCIDSSAVVRYTTDGTIPTTASVRYEVPFNITESTDFIFRTFRANGKKESMVKTRFIKETYSPSIEVNAFELGLQAVWHEYRSDSCAGISEAPINGTYQVSDVVIPEGVKGNIGLVITGFIKIPKEDIYTFRLTSDDGSLLKIGGRVIVDNDGAHSLREIIGQHALSAGLHPIEVRYFDSNGGSLNLKVMDSEGKQIPFSELYVH